MLSNYFAHAESRFLQCRVTFELLPAYIEVYERHHFYSSNYKRRLYSRVFLRKTSLPFFISELRTYYSWNCRDWLPDL